MNQAQSVEEYTRALNRVIQYGAMGRDVAAVNAWNRNHGPGAWVRMASGEQVRVRRAFLRRGVGPAVVEIEGHRTTLLDDLQERRP